MKTINDAPHHYDLAAAEAWVSGYEAGCENREKLISLLREVLGVPQAAPWLVRAGDLYARIECEVKS